MTVFELAIIRAARQLKPGDDGYATAQAWACFVIAAIEYEPRTDRRRHLYT